MSTHRIYYRRSFLNRPRFHLGAFVIGDVQVCPPWTSSGRSRVDATLTLSDCNRVVELDFAGEEPLDWDNALHKARLLRQVVDDFTAGLEAAVAEARKAPAPRR